MRIDLFDELSKEKLLDLLNKQECEQLDFKQMLDLRQPKEVMEFAKDVLAMTNTMGGHIVVGVEDRTWQVTGMSEETSDILADAKFTNEKLREYVGPQLTIYTSVHSVDDSFGTQKKVGIVYIPQSPNLTPAQKTASYPEDPARPKDPKRVFLKSSILYRRGEESKVAETPDDMSRLQTRPRCDVSVLRPRGVNDEFVNPYEFANTASEHMFKGREAEINKLLNQIESGTHTVIFGLQRIGKTSLVKEAFTVRYKSRPNLHDRILFARVDLQSIGSEYVTYKTFLQSLIVNVAKAAKSAIEVEELEAEVDSYLSDPRMSERGQQSHLLNKCERMLERIAQSTKKKIVLFLDEFSELCRITERNEELRIKNPARSMNIRTNETLVDVSLMRWFSALLKNDILKGKVIFVLAVRPFMAEHDTRRDLQILKLLKSIYLYHLDEGASKNLIMQPLIGHLSYEPEAVDYLYRLTSGHPYLIQYILKDVVDTVRAEGRASIRKADIQAFENVMIEEDTAYEAQFDLLDSDYSVEEVMNERSRNRGRGTLALIAKIGNECKEGWVQYGEIIRSLKTLDCSSEEVDALLKQLRSAKILQESVFEDKMWFRFSIPLLRKRYVKQNMYGRYFKK